MSDCERVRSLLVFHAEGIASAGETKEVAAHLSQCSDCRAEAHEVAGLIACLADPALFQPPADLRWQSLDQTLAARARSAGARRRWLPVELGRPAWAAALAATLLIAFGSIRYAGRIVMQPVPAPVPPGNAAFMERMEEAYAREAAARYLSECQDLLVEVVRAEKPCDKDTVDVSAEVMRARELLQRKRMLESELNAGSVVHSRELCDDLESFLVDLSLADRCETPAELGRMERIIRSRQLLLRINVVQSELS